jgi:hypothetical protein
MTRPQIAEGLERLVLRLANAVDDPPPPMTAPEWAYIKGVASASILELRARLLDLPHHDHSGT